mmetsp:Transcript_9397/g.15088  ORF Transcript_9397/g.15088 Transcript_9397/m.15088 type:complete len:245 (-) Transcript_9397:52-786(-)
MHLLASLSSTSIIALLFTMFCLNTCCTTAWISTITTTTIPTTRNNGRPVTVRHPHRNDLRTVLHKIDNQKDMLEFIEEPMDSKDMVGDKIVGTPEQDELADLVLSIVRAADARKAENIVALRVSKVSTVTSFVVIVTGNSRPQNQAIAASIKDDVQELYGMLPGSTGVPEGSPDSGWTVLDYGSVMVHVMTPKSRLFYNVEGQWKDKGGEYMNLAEAVLPNSAVEEKKAGTMQGLSAEEDPFWS